MYISYKAPDAVYALKCRMKEEAMPTAALVSGELFREAPVSFGSSKTHVAHLLYMGSNELWQIGAEKLQVFFILILT